MFRRQPVVALLVLALVAACAAPPPARAQRSRAPHGEPPVADRIAIVAHGAPTPSPYAVAVTDAHSGDAEPDGRAATPSPTPTTMIVRAYFLMRDGSGGEVVNEPTLVPVLRTVPKSTATATAAMKALLAGPSAKERAPVRPIETLIPAGSKLLGIESREASRRSTCPPSSPRYPLTTPGISGATRFADVSPRSSTP